MVAYTTILSSQFLCLFHGLAIPLKDGREQLIEIVLENGDTLLINLIVNFALLHYFYGCIKLSYVHEQELISATRNK